MTLLTTIIVGFYLFSISDWKTASFRIRAVTTNRSLTRRGPSSLEALGSGWYY